MIRNKLNKIRFFFDLLGTPNYYQGVDKPNRWQRLYAWRIGPATAWKVAGIIWDKEKKRVTNDLKNAA